ncbi:MAG TPA: glutamine--fructose-6-phosphate transaminase (isomerizing) [Ferrovibrio sp.]|jgi:glucosamine--fructose-6-phosphate aminotransferase (isomerizing)|uniref:glutamine--fructose-6-phosphate transaminase (isomerizing) n=1 Tax=Ferrovibrio sp. TaxID=1917215 RepID=UPI002B4B0ABE|nr:glutamine--fructose-6-phosphate transaminase (isomerizing) [Ferrovibrio sp.]HLT79162.1 glutamine--fructose-6-phosphate transaminase (isomerizing) [Ferrovibrio sp.]
MCGIVGVVATRDVVPLLVDGLKRLEYRGYDSAGIATLGKNGAIERRRAEGKIAKLEARLSQEPLDGLIGIAHTRWATHGAPNEENAHPHATERVALVHNGIIENYREIAEELLAKGHRFYSQTDTEVALRLIDQYLAEGNDPQQAVQAALNRFRGAFALGILFHGKEDLLIGARRGAPLAVGFGDGEMYLGSDALALAPLTGRIAYLEEGDSVVLTRTDAKFFDQDGKPTERAIRPTAISGAMIGKGNYRHYMQKEIYEQPAVMGDTINTVVSPTDRLVHLPDLGIDLAKLSRITIVACGTSYYSGLVAKYWLERYGRIGVEVDVASEFRYREAPVDPNSLSIFISQSGETADTLAALRYVKNNGGRTLAIINVPESSMAREAHGCLLTKAGPEIGVASTKAFTCQLVTLAAFSLAVAQARKVMQAEEAARLMAALIEVPAHAAEVLNHDDDLLALAEKIMDARDVLYIGRGPCFPLALEGALKLKEISYIHAEGYAAGELKHGPIALIDEGVPVIVIAPSDALFEKTISNMQEVMARGGKVIFMSDRRGFGHIDERTFATVELPEVDPFVAPILYAIPVQLLAYHVAVLKGTDVDQPRNLAKSVTVE